MISNFFCFRNKEGSAGDWREMLRPIGIVLSLILFSMDGWGEDALENSSYDEIRRRYLFVADFTVKPETRPHTSGIFWRYPMTFPKPKFDIQWGYDDNQHLVTDYPATPGQGRAIEHLNRGRMLFLQGELKDAKNSLLSLRARYGKKFKFHRRNDYFLGNIFLRIAEIQAEKFGGNFLNSLVKPKLGNAATFLSWAFLRKKDFPDSLIDRVAPRNIYNLAVIYHSFGRYSGSYGAVREGLNFLNQTGRIEYRYQMRRLLAELMILNQDYLSAVQEFDTILRQDLTPDKASSIFARVADIYFDRNNFELAEDLYAIANRLDRYQKVIHPYQFILRGESLFWIGRYDDAQKMFHYGLKSLAFPEFKGTDHKDLSALASMRIGDAWLAKKQFDQAKIQYFRHAREFPHHPTRLFAKLRLACLELPEFKGNNIRHARKLLAILKEKISDLPEAAREVAWTCEMKSMAQYDKDENLIDKMKRFFILYPKNKYLGEFGESVREIQAKKLTKLLDGNKPYKAIEFFEKTRSFLFKKITDSQKFKLFRAYMDAKNVDAATEFWNKVDKSNLSQHLNPLRLASFFGEKFDGTKQDIWKERNEELAREMDLKGIKIKFNQFSKLYLARILATTTGMVHAQWVLENAKRWVKDDFIVMCQIIYPFLAGAWRDSAAYHQREELNLLGANLIDQFLPQVLQFETSCGYSLLEFERNLYEGRLENYAVILLNRNYLPVNQDTVKIFWILSEKLREIGSISTAKKIWEHIVKNGSVNLKEVRYAKTRLRPIKTELESLWQ